MNAQPDRFFRREQIYRDLKGRMTASPNGEWLARIVASWCAGEGALPDHLGLAPDHFGHLLETRFPGLTLPGIAPSGRVLDFSRMLEKEDLVRLLRSSCVAESPEDGWLIDLLVAGCLGEDHLWQDLGLWARTDLSGLIDRNFPELAARNTQDMKWKKFLYKQLCEAEGIYVCRAPSCSVCADYAKCYGPED
jgi:nitrogen fixation protein NifQ